MEIKFMFWDEYNKELVSEDNIFVYNHTPFRASRKDTRLVINVPLLFTGKKDYEGKEIYEGHIIECGGDVGEVQYSEEQAAFIILWYPHNEKKKSGADGLGSTHPSPLKKIIGHIYSTPEIKKQFNLK